MSLVKHRFAELPPLPFGNRVEHRFTSSEAMSQTLGTLDGWSADFVPDGDAKMFAAKMAGIRTNGLNVSVVAHSPIHSRSCSQHTHTVFIPFYGGGNGYRLNGKSIDFAAKKNGMFAPAGERSGKVAYGSMLLLDIDETRLTQTARAMIGLDENCPIGIDTSAPKELPVRQGALSYDRTLRHYCDIVDQYANDHAVLAALGLDDAFYRIAVMLMLPERFSRPSEKGSLVRGHDARRGVKAACDYMMANLGESISLSQLERVSGLSARALQYAFAKEWNCSPMRWLASRRYEAVRRHLMAGTVATVTEAALSYNLVSPSLFAASYRKRYGELPSVTLENAKHRRY